MYHCISHQYGLVAFNLILLSTQGILVSVTAITAKTILGNQGSTAQFTYRVPLGVDASTIHCTWSHNRNLITIDSVKYIQPDPRSLQINNVIGTDEGTYTCHYNYSHQEVSVDVANIYVMWAAVFAEQQEASVTSAHVGGTARFDARVTFVGGGAQQRKQKVNLLQLFKDGTQVYRCRNWSGSETSPCTSMGRFNVEKQGSEKFDFYITLNDVRVEDGGNYEARLEVIHPVTGSYLSSRKTITLNVTAPPLPPTINIEARGEPNIGDPFSLRCNVSLDGDATVEDITVSWQNPTGTVIKSTTTSTYLDIQFQHLSKDDEGLYTCTATVRVTRQGSEEMLTANGSMVVVINETLSEVESFQLCIGPFFLSDCSALAVDSKKGRELENEIREEITRNVLKQYPQCANGMSESFIQPGTLRCSKDAARLIYRSNIEVTGAHNASEIVQVIEEWVNSTVPGEATLRLWPFVMDLDSRCPVSITSLDSPYPALGTGESQVQVSSTKERIDSCLAQTGVH